jgi:hypothetical protein
MSTEPTPQPGVYPRQPVIVDMTDDELTELVTAAAARLPATLPPNAEAARERAEAAVSDADFDAYMAISRLVVGGIIEGTDQLSQRLKRIEGELRREQADAPTVGEINTPGDVVRYAAVGLALSASEGLRARFMKALNASDLFWEFSGNTVKPFTENRITGFFTAPFERAFQSIVDKGQTTVNGWVERGRREEPISRELALNTVETIIEEFITLLSENPELAELVQQQSVGLVGEVVGEVRSRTVSADVLAETLVRRLLRRPTRTELPAPPPDMQDLVAPKKPLPKRD